MRTIQAGEYTISVEYDEKILGYFVTVSKVIEGQTYSVRTTISDYVYQNSPEVMKQVLEQAMRALEVEEKKSKIKEFNNPSFRRKDYVRTDQDV